MDWLSSCADDLWTTPKRRLLRRLWGVVAWINMVLTGCNSTSNPVYWRPWTITFIVNQSFVLVCPPPPPPPQSSSSFCATPSSIVSTTTSIRPNHSFYVLFSVKYGRNGAQITLWRVKPRLYCYDHYSTHRLEISRASWQLLHCVAGFLAMIWPVW